MEGIVVAVVVMLILAIIAYAVKSDGKRPTAPSHNQVTVLVLGFRGSGKTLMLASLFKHFRLGGPAGITLLTDDRSEHDLEQLVDRIQDTAERYLPESTALGDTRAWSFAVRVLAGQGRSADAFELRYLDYAGEYAEAVSGVGEFGGENEFSTALRGADILIGVLDGEKVRRLMVEPGQSRTVHEIDRLLRLLMRAQQNCIHLVISKWDLLVSPQGHRFSLDEIIRRLERESAGFRSFRCNPKFSRIRIIPVSTLGDGFLEALPDGTLAKKPGAHWNPSNVDLPFYCALPDILAGDITLMRAHAAQGSADRTTISRERLAQITLGAFALADIALKITSHGFMVTVPFSAIGARIRDRLAAAPRQPAEFGRTQALAHVLRTSYEHTDAFDSDPRWRVHAPLAPERL